MDLKKQLNELKQKMQAVVDGAKASARDLNAEEVKNINTWADEARELAKKIEAVEKSEKALQDLLDFAGPGDDGDDAGVKRLALTGARAKAAANRIGSVIREKGGTKALLAPGTVATPVPLDETPIERRRVPTSVLDLMRIVQHDTPTWRGLIQTGFTNNASIVPPGAVKPTSGVQIEGYEQSLSVIAHLSEPVDKFLLEDNTSLSTFISGNLIYGLALALEEEILNGDGTPFMVSGVETKHFHGILGANGIQAQAPGVDRATTLRAAATKLEVIGFTPDVFVLSPADWEAIETQRDDQNGFLITGSPVNRAERRLWGTQVVTSTKLTNGTALALNLSSMHIDIDTAGIRTLWDGSGELFDKNQIKARVEGRFGFSLERPEGAVVATLPQL
jgi:HK97 family phage major capsid protein